MGLEIAGLMIWAVLMQDIGGDKHQKQEMRQPYCQQDGPFVKQPERLESGQKYEIAKTDSDGTENQQMRQFAMMGTGANPP